MSRDIADRLLTGLKGYSETTTVVTKAGTLREASAKIRHLRQLVAYHAERADAAAAEMRERCADFCETHIPTIRDTWTLTPASEAIPRRQLLLADALRALPLASEPDGAKEPKP